MRLKFLLFAAVGLLTVSGRADSFMVDYGKGECQLPDWLRGREAGDSGLAAAAFVFAPETPEGDLLLTVVFEERDGGFLRVFWEGPNTALTLAENLQEGVNMTNKRTLLLRSDLLKNGGTLTLQSGAKQLPLKKIKWEPLVAQTTLTVSGGKTAAVVSASAEVLGGDDVSGETTPAAGDQWRDAVVTAGITERAERIEDGVGFEFELGAAPELARLECEVNGLALDGMLEIWLNDRRAGTLTVSVPELTDAGCGAEADGQLVFHGWRRGAALVPVEALTVGVNRLQFTAANGGPIARPLAVKAVKWQLKYPSVKTVNISEATATPVETGQREPLQAATDG
ncbi:MAG: hypothetical protein LBD30_04875 [Verrucomicrobiales bacterium]|jgi:hypothetical protein|nr:hypothetical protein [Verrucomicrobiales bacterium]